MFVLALAGTLPAIIPPIEGGRGMVTPSDRIKRRRWTDAAIESELRVQRATLGHFPTRSELVASGLRGLWDAMRSSGGVDAWRERVKSGPPASSGARVESGPPASSGERVESGPPASSGEHAESGLVAPSREEIALRAYELYMQGFPGDAEAHWLAAEQELASESKR
jgi:Protein of unknown function (DUF2934)